MDVRLEQGHENLAQGSLHICGRQLSFATQVFEDALQFFGQIIEHGVSEVFTTKAEARLLPSVYQSQVARALACELAPILNLPGAGRQFEFEELIRERLAMLDLRK